MFYLIALYSACLVWKICPTHCKDSGTFCFLLFACRLFCHEACFWNVHHIRKHVGIMRLPLTMYGVWPYEQHIAKQPCIRKVLKEINVYVSIVFLRKEALLTIPLLLWHQPVWFGLFQKRQWSTRGNSFRLSGGALDSVLFSSPRWDEW